MNAEDMPIANEDRLNQEDCSKQKNQGDLYSQNGNYGMGHMSGGEIKDKAKVAGEINENNRHQCQEVSNNGTINNHYYSSNSLGEETITITKTKIEKIGDRETSETMSVKFRISIIDNIEKFLEDFTGCPVKVKDVKKGSIEFIIKSSEEGIKNIVKSFKSGDLAPLFQKQFNLELESVKLIDSDSSDNSSNNQSQKLLSFTIAGDVSQADIDILKAALIDTSDDDEEIKNQEKSRLIEEIKTQGVVKQKLRNRAMRQRFAPLFLRFFLTGFDFVFMGADLRKADLSGFKLRDADLSGADLSGVYLVRADLSGANLSGANLGGANLGGANLSGANLSGINLSGANLISADLSGANLSGANLSGIKLGDANLSGADLRKANLSDIDLSDIDLSGADLSGVYLVRANNVRGINLSGADLRKADLSGFKLRDANLRGINLSGANLSGVDLSGFKLRGANLSGAYLRDADLSGAYLSGANLSGANLISTNLSGAYLISANLSGANLSGADLRNTDLNNVIVKNTLFSSDSLGMSKSLKDHLEDEGAIFEDSSGDRSEVFSKI